MIFSSPPAYTLSKTERKGFNVENIALNDSPGPLYNTFGLGRRSSSLSYGIGKSSRYQINHGQQLTPGPNVYNKTKQSQKTITFPKSEYKDPRQQETIEPGYYSPNYQINKQSIQNYSIGTKYPSILNDNRQLPGPGAYQNDPKMLKRSSSIKFGNDKKLSTSKSKIPGPGDYQILINRKMTTNGKLFGTSNKFASNRQDTPGPSQYQKKSFVEVSLKNKMGKSISGRFHNSQNPESNQNLTGNAFGKYDISQKFYTIAQNHPNYSIGKSLRKVFRGDQNPGPTDYIKERYEPKQSINVSIPQSKRIENNLMINNPGPGTYNQQNKKSLSMTIPRSKSTTLLSSNPGVGRYNLQNKQLKKGLKFQNSNRISQVSSNAAGVGDYNVQKNKMNVITIPKSQRFTEKNIHKPGPGDYHILSSIGKFNNYRLNQY